MQLNDYEVKHIDYLRKNAGECALFLKKNEEFPLSKPCKVALLGNGARKTIKGGTGSGDVASRFFKNCEQGLKEAGFEITSSTWLDAYDAFYQTTIAPYIKECKKDARKNGYMAMIYSMGYFDNEKNYDISCDYEGDACIYVLARNSGEGNDRRNIKGDVLLSDKEVADILYLNKKFKKFLLVLNVGGVIDLTPVLEVSNILLLSQLGVVTGDALADIVLGKQNPSGKLTTTWAVPETYPCFDEFGDLHDTYYKEGLYVGYRYFTSAKITPTFAFGYGLSYSNFEISNLKGELNDSVVTLSAEIKNISNTAGKEVLQAYVSKPNDRLNQAAIELAGYKKTTLLNANEVETVEIKINVLDLISYDTAKAADVLLKGNYVFRLGNASNNLTPVMIVKVEEDIIVNQLANKFNNSGVEDMVINFSNEELNVPVFTFVNNVTTNKVEYKKDTYVEEDLVNLTNDELALMCLGHHGHGIAAIVGETCQRAPGGAGETTLAVSAIKDSLTMADGPAGLRLKQIYGVDEKGIYDVSIDPLFEKIIMFSPKIVAPFLKPKKNRHGELHYQYTTAIPIGTALAQSFNDDFVRSCGDLVGEEMEIFDVDLWLAPALNIHRNILCGRNFEYYSEDPFVSGHIAASMCEGVHMHSKKGVTIKHFAANNQEINRNNNNSHISERAFREIYLKGFNICINRANPDSIMTSYNLLNGVHTSESYELVNDVLRCEWKYDGLVMTDWIASGRSLCSKSIYPAPYASNNILAGNDLTMSGCPADEKDIKKALKKGKLTREDLLFSASRIYRQIKRQRS